MAGSATPLTVTKVTRFSVAEMESMERMLSTWIDDQTQRLKTPLSQCVIQQKTRSLCSIICNVKKDIRAYYEVLEEKRKNAQKMTLDAVIAAKPSTPSAPTTPRTSKQNTAFRQLFKTSVKPQPSMSEQQPSTSEPQLSVQIDNDNESEVTDDPGSEESEVADDPGSEESEVADNLGSDDDSGSEESEVADNPGSDDDPGSEESEVADDPGSEESEVADDPSLLLPQ
ncbi:CENPB DNA-binding domain containing protein 1-like 47, partial [Homarus americanus]